MTAAEIEGALDLRFVPGSRPAQPIDAQAMISVIVPSRGRPERMRGMIESLFDTAGGVVEVVAVVDKDDPTRREYVGTLDRGGAYDVRVVSVKPQQFLSNYWNLGAEHANGGVLMMGADDLIFRSQSWAFQVARAFGFHTQDYPLFVYGRDGYHDHKLGTHGFINRAWYEATGRFTYPGFSRDYADTYLNVLGANVGRRLFLPDVLIEHMHPLFGKTPDDTTYARRRPTQGAAQGQWEASLGAPMANDMNKLLEAMK